MPLVSVEGIDGAGKSSVVDALTTAFPDATVTRYPDSSRRIGKQIRAILNADVAGEENNVDEMVMAFLFLADHTDQYVREIEPALAAGQLVIADRHVDSLYTTQGITTDDRLDASDTLDWWRSLVTTGGWTCEPDLTLYLDVPVAVAVSRREPAEGHDRYEAAELLERKRHAYLALVEATSRFVVLDGTDSPDAVATAAVTAVRSFLAE
jgi:dTMP kinase